MNNDHATDRQHWISKMQNLYWVEPSQSACDQESHDMLDKECEIGNRQDGDNLEGEVEVVGIPLDFLVYFIAIFQHNLDMSDIIQLDDFMVDMG